MKVFRTGILAQVNFRPFFKKKAGICGPGRQGYYLHQKFLRAGF